MATKTYFHELATSNKQYIWEVTDTLLFDELILSWKAARPYIGSYTFHLSIKMEEGWSEWLFYAQWEREGQKCGQVKSLHFPVHIDKDTLEIMSIEGKYANGFRVRIDACEGADLSQLSSLAVCVSRTKELQTSDFEGSRTINLKVPLQSQMELDHTRCRDMCSPTSTAMALNYLLKHRNIVNPLNFSDNVRDEAFNIYGNWVLNAAEAASVLSDEGNCWVQRLNGFSELYQSLEKKVPVVVSVKGPLPGSALPYAQGHLLVVKGYSTKKRQVLCMDPGFPSSEQTDVAYDLTDFLQAWSRRGFIAYMFSSKRYV